MTNFSDEPQYQKPETFWKNLPKEYLAATRARLRWLHKARTEQITPHEKSTPGWRIWLVLAGRGWGKTRCGAEDIAAYALWNEKVRIAVIAPTFSDACDVCIEGESGLLRVLPKACIRSWHRSTGDLTLFNGSRIKIFSAEQPERLRGPQHHRVWCDELGAWPNRAAFDQLWFGLRLGPDPRVIITTTPRNTELIRELWQRKDVFLTRGRTLDNVSNLSAAVLHHLQERYAGTRLGRQELEAELLQDTEGALWQRAEIDAKRVPHAPALLKIVVAIDPAMGSGKSSDETGIVAAGRAEDGRYYVLADWSGRYSPEGWAERAVALYTELQADTIIAEINAGGEMVEQILRSARPQIAFKSVRALRGKTERALPIAALYEQGRVSHVGCLAKLEDQMCRFAPNGYTEGSPDRVDALVWALTALGDAPRAEPRVRQL